MKRFVLLVAVAFLVSPPAFSQLGISWGLGANLAFPSSDLDNIAATGYGGTGLVKFGLIPLVDLTGGIEYINMGTKDAAGGEFCTHAWGYMVGGRVNLLVIAYGGLELGAYSFSTKFTAPSVPDTDATNTEFFFAPMVGVSLGMLDVGLRYVVADNSDFFSVRAMAWF
ncbi:MAG: hypothetical protein OEV30_04475 [Ignavibacteria bacterium]|nr:hypothetical protein [Ignavibacteria bacterium]